MRHLNTLLTSTIVASLCLTAPALAGQDTAPMLLAQAAPVVEDPKAVDAAPADVPATPAASEPPAAPTADVAESADAAKAEAAKVEAAKVEAAKVEAEKAEAAKVEAASAAGTEKPTEPADTAKAEPAATPISSPDASPLAAEPVTAKSTDEPAAPTTLQATTAQPTTATVSEQEDVQKAIDSGQDVVLSDQVSEEERATIEQSSARAHRCRSARDAKACYSHRAGHYRTGHAQQYRGGRAHGVHHEGRELDVEAGRRRCGGCSRGRAATEPGWPACAGSG